jgi:hypothetical protein
MWGVNLVKYRKWLPKKPIWQRKSHLHQKKVLFSTSRIPLAVGALCVTFSATRGEPDINSTSYAWHWRQRHLHVKRNNSLVIDLEWFRKMFILSTLHVALLWTRIPCCLFPPSLKWSASFCFLVNFNNQIERAKRAWSASRWQFEPFLPSVHCVGGLGGWLVGEIEVRSRQRKEQVGKEVQMAVLTACSDSQFFKSN